MYTILLPSQYYKTFSIQQHDILNKNSALLLELLHLLCKKKNISPVDLMSNIRFMFKSDYISITWKSNYPLEFQGSLEQITLSLETYINSKLK